MSAETRAPMKVVRITQTSLVLEPADKSDGFAENIHVGGITAELRDLCEPGAILDVIIRRPS